MQQHISNVSSHVPAWRMRKSVVIESTSMIFHNFAINSWRHKLPLDFRDLCKGKWLTKYQKNKCIRNIKSWSTTYFLYDFKIALRRSHFFNRENINGTKQTSIRIIWQQQEEHSRFIGIICNNQPKLNMSLMVQDV